MKKTILSLLVMTYMFSLSSHAATTSSSNTKQVSAKAKKQTLQTKAKKSHKSKKKSKHVEAVATSHIDTSEILRMMVLNSNDIRVVTEKTSGSGLELSQYSLAQVLEIERQAGNTVRYDMFSCNDLISEPSTICRLSIEEKVSDQQTSAIRIMVRAVKENGQIRLAQVVDDAAINNNNTTNDRVPEQSALILM